MNATATTEVVARDKPSILSLLCCLTASTCRERVEEHSESCGSLKSLSVVSVLSLQRLRFFCFVWCVKVRLVRE